MYGFEDFPGAPGRNYWPLHLGTTVNVKKSGTWPA